MTESDDPNRDYERLLLRSGALDRPLPRARERTLEAGLKELTARSTPPRKNTTGTLAACGAFLAAAGAGLAFHFQRTPAAPALVSAEPPAVSAAPLVVERPKRSACPEIVVAQGDALLIDDFEAYDPELLQRDGRGGAWLTFDDGTARQKVPSGSQLFPTFIPGRRGESRRALHASGGKFADWGVTTTVPLADNACYDVSKYGGLRFWAKGKGQVYVGLQLIDVQERKFGGSCSEDCYNVHRKAIKLGARWQEHEVRWEELQQLWPKNRIDFDPARVRSLEFLFQPENTPFELWVDDLEFTPR
jgi:hypothetical protein